MASTDGGKTWAKRSDVTDAPFHGDCEVGLVELAPDHLLAVTRIGFSGGSLGTRAGSCIPMTTVVPGKADRGAVLRSTAHGGTAAGRRLFATFRNRWGTFCHLWFCLA